MEKKILWINPVGGAEFNEPIRELLNECKHENTKVDVTSFEDKDGPKHVEYHYYEDLVLPATLKKIKEAEEDGFDASVIGCFYDPGLDTAREIADDMVVAAPAESGMNIAVTYGHKFSIIVGRKKWIPQMENNVIKYGYKDRLASFRSVGLGVLEFHEDEERTAKMITEEARKAVEEDNAEVIILGCTIQFGFYKELQEEIGVPVIDSVVGPFKYAEFLAELKNRFGWKQSKVGGYESPPQEEMDAWNLEEQYL
ncbi:MAG: hydantoin racemase [Candidatus Thermoplasmatota archaeon]|nr:hydantoin racemase [Candidatus Thermoplasmatota archaeon]MBS3789750.1 hydantoin racemase [Candidatus Thermoplasmatota archaeon]